jgi:hypothetical protein
VVNIISKKPVTFVFKKESNLLQFSEEFYTENGGSRLLLKADDHLQYHTQSKEFIKCRVSVNSTLVVSTLGDG